MKIGNIELKNKIFLAPMAGVSDVGFRAIACYFGAEIAFTEMVSAKGLVLGERKTPISIFSKKFVSSNKKLCLNKSASLLICEDSEKIKAVQLFGSEPSFMEKACGLDLLKNFDIIDINMGCPAPKIVRNGEGSALMKNLPLAREIIKSCVLASKRPVTVKFRKGFSQDNCEEFAKMCQEAGASAITIHARLSTQGYSGIVDYDCVRRVVEAVDIPVIGSGDVKDEKTLRKMFETGVIGVMVGRASQGNLEIFKTLNEALTNKKTPMAEFVLKDDFFKDVLLEEDVILLEKDERFIKYICAKKHVQILKKFYTDDFIVKYMRKHFLWYCSGFKNLSKKVEIAKSLNLENSLKILKEIITSSLF